MTPALKNAAALCACTVALGACVSILPRAQPVDLYRFEPATSGSPAQPTERSVSVLLGNGNFVREAAGDSIVVLMDGEIAHIAHARWALPAEILFRQAVAQSFDHEAGPARLLRRGEPGHPDFTLSLDVERFETEYGSGRGKAPTVVVTFHAMLVRTRDQAMAGETSFEARVPTADDRVSAIVPAYDEAVSDTLGRLSAWVQACVLEAT